ncbi:MAG: RNA polymerase factor sigma-54 [Xylophilus ampelinus]
MKPSLSLRVSQHLALTPQLQQSIRLLQLSTLELSQEVGQMLDENPFLEVDGGADDAPAGAAEPAAAPRDEERAAPDDAPYADASGAAPAASGAAESESDRGASGDDEGAWDGAVDRDTGTGSDDGDWGSGGDAPGRSGSSSGDDEADATDLASEHESLTAFLHRQALSLRLSEEDRAALRFLIESLDDDGYLEDSLAVLAAGLAGADADHEEIESLVHHFTVALRLLQSLEPAGVGARDLAECLTLQVRAIQHAADEGTPGAALADLPPPAVLDVALAICAQPIELLAKRDVKRLAGLARTDEATAREAMALIARLEPKPGRRFVNVERNIVVPDVLVRPVGRGAAMRMQVQLNPEVMPRLRVHDIYANALRQHKGEGSAALQQRLQEARWFIKNIQQRFDTILRVSNAIVERQKNFFTHGALAMRPLVLREIADELGLHESTISRVTTAKYMATPFGTFELKYFFGSALGTETGGNASSTAVRALIKQFVAAENAKKPLSDSQIADMLKEQGIECARRTVAKYREALRIAPANLRKAL